MTDTVQTLAPPLSSQLAKTLSLGNARLFWVVLCLSIVPLWFGRYLPAVDLAQHAAQVAALKQVLSGNEAFTRLFEINWFTPYLLGYLLLYALSFLLPIAVATKVLVTLAVVAVPLCTGTLLRTVGADERWKWLAIPGSYSFAFYWGFMTFIVAVPLGLLFLVQTWGFVRQPTLRNGLLIALTSVLLFFSHVMVLCAASLFALGIVAANNYRNPTQLVLRSLPYAAPLPLMGLWWLGTYARETTVQTALPIYATLPQKMLQLFVQPSGLDHFSLVVTPLVTLAIALLPRLTGASLSRRPERWLPFVLCIAVFLALPTAAFNTGYLYERMGLFLVPLWLMAWDPPAERSGKWDWIAMVVVVVWLSANVGRFAAFARETQSFDRVTAAAESGRTVGVLMNGMGSRFFDTPVYAHWGAWYQATRGGIVDFNFADFYPQIVRYKRDAPARIDELVAINILNFRWDVHGGAHYDYFLVRSGFDVRAPIFGEQAPQIELVAHSDGWWLFRNGARSR